MNRKVCVVTGSRAEFGLLRCLMENIDKNQNMTLQIIATGMHLSEVHGFTYREIEEAGLTIDSKVEMLLGSDTASAVTKSVGLGVIGFADSLETLAPDILVLLGDRFEIFAAGAAAMIAGIPIAHIHGGELTEAAFDDAIRHSITKMSHLHFVATEEYRRRVIQLGENPVRVFNVGGLGVDAIKRITLMTREQVEQSLNLEFAERSLLITFHPVTLEGNDTSARQMHELVAALEELKDTTLIFTMPNADPGGQEIGKIIHNFANHHRNAKVYTSLGQLRYFSCLAQVDAVVGNSSSGLLEAPTFGIGTINIGDRQKGRLKAPSVIDCEPERHSIQQALKKLYANEFQTALGTITSPYGSGGASQTITEVLEKYPLDTIFRKAFYDLPDRPLAVENRQ